MLNLSKSLDNIACIFVQNYFQLTPLFMLYGSCFLLVFSYRSSPYHSLVLLPVYDIRQTSTLFLSCLAKIAKMHQLTEAL